MINEKYHIIENVLRKTWEKSYDSAIFGKYKLIFKVCEKHHKFIIQIKNSLTKNIYTVKDKFNTYDEAIDWMSHIKDNVIDINNESLVDLIHWKGGTF